MKSSIPHLVSNPHTFELPSRLSSNGALNPIDTMAESRGPELQRAAIAFYVVACGAVLLRCYVRTRIVKQFGVDDWFMLAAIVSGWVCYWGYADEGRFALRCLLFVCCWGFGMGRDSICGI